MRRILRVDMGTLRTTELPCDGEHRRLGGRALTSALVAAEVPPLCHPLSAANMLAFAPGLLAGGISPSAGRLSAGAKSPLTGTIKESNAGGTAAHALARLGIAALVLEQQPADPDARYVLKIDASSAQVVNMPDLRGAGNYDTVRRLGARFGEHVACITIGPAGEMRLCAASVAVTDLEHRPTRHAGRGGLGAVMGAKQVKAIVLDTGGCSRPASADPAAMKDACDRFTAALKKHPVTSQTLPTLGTNALAAVVNAAGAYPTRNFATGTFEGVDRISGEAAREVMLKRMGKTRHSCSAGCLIGCSSIYPDEDGRFLSKGPEYETVWAHGADCGIADLDAIARMDRLDDDLGLDTIEMGAAFGVAMEGGLLKFGDHEAVIRILDEEIRHGTPLGRLLGSGAATVARAFGVRRVPCVKGQAMPAYDPRAAKGIGVTYATTPMGADHTAGYCIAANILGIGGTVDPLKPQGQIELSRDLQVATAALDSSGLCLFVAFAMLDMPEAGTAVLDMLRAHTGEPWTLEEYLALGRRTLAAEVGFNRRAGFNAEHDRLPDFCTTERLAPHQTVFDVPAAELDQVHAHV